MKKKAKRTSGLRFVVKFSKNHRFSWALTGKQFKMYSPGAAKLARRSVEANEAGQWLPWKDSVCIPEPKVVWSTGCTVTLTDFIEDCRPATRQEFDLLIVSVLERVPQKSEVQPWKKCFDSSILLLIWENLGKSMTERLEERMTGVDLPVTGINGDLKKGNVLVDSRGKVWVVDWDTFDTRGSFFQEAWMAWLRERAGTAHCPPQEFAEEEMKTMRRLQMKTGLSLVQGKILYAVGMMQLALRNRPEDQKRFRERVMRFGLWLENEVA